MVLGLYGVENEDGCSNFHPGLRAGYDRLCWRAGGSAGSGSGVSLLDSLSQQVSELRQQASQGNRQAEEKLLALLSGQGGQILMVRHKTAAG